MDPKRFGRLLGAGRAAKGMTRKELAEKPDVTDEALTKRLIIRENKKLARIAERNALF